MPYRKKRSAPMRRRRYAKKRYGRRFKKSAQSTMVRGPGHAIVSDRLFTELRYFKNTKLVPSVASVTFDAVFSGNSVYDCDNEVTDKKFSALGLPRLGLLYNKFRVHASKCTVKFLSTANNSSSYAKIALAPSTSAKMTGANILSRTAYAKSAMLAGSVGTPKTTLSQYMSTKKMLGLKNIANSEDLAGVTNTNSDNGTTISAPDKEWFWHIALDSINGTATLDGSIFADIEIVYYVEFYDRLHILVQDLEDDEIPLTPV